MTVMMDPLALSLSRDASVDWNQVLTKVRAASEAASAGLRGSSMMMMSPPRPVSVPVIDVARRPPPRVVAKSPDAERLVEIIVPGNSSRYQGDDMIARQSR